MEKSHKAIFTCIRQSRCKVQMLCDAWDSLAKTAYDEDFNLLSGDINQTTVAAKNFTAAYIKAFKYQLTAGRVGYGLIWPRRIQ